MGLAHGTVSTSPVHFLVRRFEYSPLYPKSFSNNSSMYHKPNSLACLWALEERMHFFIFGWTKSLRIATSACGPCSKLPTFPKVSLKGAGISTSACTLRRSLFIQSPCISFIVLALVFTFALSPTISTVRRSSAA